MRIKECFFKFLNPPGAPPPPLSECCGNKFQVQSIESTMETVCNVPLTLHNDQSSGLENLCHKWLLKLETIKISTRTQMHNPKTLNLLLHNFIIIYQANFIIGEPTHYSLVVRSPFRTFPSSRSTVQAHLLTPIDQMMQQFLIQPPHAPKKKKVDNASEKKKHLPPGLRWFRSTHLCYFSRVGNDVFCHPFPS